MSEQDKSLLAEMLAEQRKTNQMLAAILQVAADMMDEQDDEADPLTYLDGTPK